VLMYRASEGVVGAVAVTTGSVGRLSLQAATSVLPSNAIVAKRPAWRSKESRVDLMFGVLVDIGQPHPVARALCPAGSDRRRRINEVGSRSYHAARVTFDLSTAAVAAYDGDVILTPFSDGIYVCPAYRRVRTTITPPGWTEPWSTIVSDGLMYRISAMTLTGIMESVDVEPAARPSM
jgi:hypothetical protein